MRGMRDRTATRSSSRRIKRTCSRSTRAPARSLWETVVGDRDERRLHGEQHAARHQRQSDPGHGHVPAVSARQCFIGAYDAETGKELWRFDTVALDGEPGGDTWGGLPDLFRAGGDIVDHRQLRPRARTSRTGAWRRRSRGCARAAAIGQRRPALHELDARAEPRHRQARVVLPARARRDRSISTKSSSACSSTTRARSSS